MIRDHGLLRRKLSFTEQDLDELADEFAEYAAEDIADLPNLEHGSALVHEIALEVALQELLPDCTIAADDDDADRMSLRITYPSLLKADAYLKPWVKVECGARGAYEPDVKRDITPYIQTELGSRFNLATKGVTLISAARTFWEKALILHGIYCGFRDDDKRRPGDENLISRHYYDVAMMRDRAEGYRVAVLGGVSRNTPPRGKRASARCDGQANQAIAGPVLESASGTRQSEAFHVR